VDGKFPAEREIARENLLGFVSDRFTYGFFYRCVSKVRCNFTVPVTTYSFG
jgi:hypothetical protein